MRTPEQSWITAIAEFLRIPLRIKTREQLIGFTLMLGCLSVATYLIFAEPPRSSDIRASQLESDRLERLEQRLRAEAVIVWSFDEVDEVFSPIYSSNPKIHGLNIDSIGECRGGDCREVELVRQLRLGECVRFDSKSVNDVGVRLPVLACGIFRGRQRISEHEDIPRFAGIIGAAFTEMPLKSPEGTYDPSSYQLFIMGLDIAQR